jgi:hypothetical protein
MGQRRVSRALAATNLRRSTIAARPFLLGGLLVDVKRALGRLFAPWLMLRLGGIPAV